MYVFNEALELGVITRANEQGLFSVKIRADVGNLLTIWQEYQGNAGEHKETVVPGD